jgi:hypothetical protein
VLLGDFFPEMGQISHLVCVILSQHHGELSGSGMRNPLFTPSGQVGNVLLILGMRHMPKRGFG